MTPVYSRYGGTPVGAMDWVLGFWSINCYGHREWICGHKRGVDVGDLQRRIAYGGRKGRAARRRVLKWRKANDRPGNGITSVDRDLLLSTNDISRKRRWSRQ